MEEAPEEASAPSVPSGRAWLDFELGMGGYNRGPDVQPEPHPQPALLHARRGADRRGERGDVPARPADGRPARQHRPRGGDPAGVRHLLDAVERQHRDHLQGRRARLRGRRSLPLHVRRAPTISTSRSPAARTPSRSPGEARRTCSSSPTPSTTTFAPASGLHLAHRRRARRRAGAADTASSSTMPARSSCSSSPVRRWRAPTPSWWPATRVSDDVRGAGRPRVAPLLVRHALAARATSTIAGGAVDQSFAFTARIAILIGSSNVPKAEGGAEEAPPPPPPNPKGRGHKSRRRVRRRQLEERPPPREWRRRRR